MSDVKDKKPDVKEEALLCDKMHFDAKEAYKLLRTNIIYSSPDEKCRKIGITSANIGEGKSTVATNLSYSLSATKSRVLLLELDLRLPTLSKKLNIKYKYGLTDFLAGNVPESRIIYPTDKPNWDVIFSGVIPATPTELINSQKLITFIRRLEREYDFIIFDLPPVNVVSDALVAKEVIDGYVLVVRENYSDRRSLIECVRKLDFLSIPILGFVLVDSISKTGHYRKRHYGKYKNYYYYGKHHKRPKEVDKDDDWFPYSHTSFYGWWK